MSERKPDSERVNRNPRVHPDTWIVWDGKTRGEPLPTWDLDGEWSDATLDWWNYVRNSPQAMLFQPSDWYLMHIAARLHNQMHTPKRVLDKDGNIQNIPCTPGELKALASEFRTYIDTYGFSRQARTRYGINIVTPEELETAAVQEQIKSTHSVVDYRKKFSGE